MKRCSEKNPRLPIEIHLRNTHDQHQIFTSQFCKYTSTHFHNSKSDQDTLFQPLLTKLLISYTLQIEESMKYNYSCQVVAVTERLLSKSELNHNFGKTYEIVEGTFVLHKFVRANPKNIPGTTTKKNR